MLSASNVLQPESNENDASAEFVENEPGRPNHPRDESDGVLYFPVTVDERICDKTKSLMQDCGDAIVSIEEESVHSRHQAKIWICLREAAFSQVLHAIITGLPTAEFGRVTHFPPHHH